MSNKEKDPGMQIPTENNVEQTEEVLQKQASIPGQKRDDELVHNFPQAASLAQMLKDLEFPSDKKTIMKFVEDQHHRSPESKTRDILNLIQKIPEQRQYNNVFEVAEAAKLVDSSF
jgi:hypothetical protein